MSTLKLPQPRGDVRTLRDAGSPERASAFQQSAPQRIWLNVFGLEDDYRGAFPANHEDITWAVDEVGDLDIPYVRADLAAPVSCEARDTANAAITALREQLDYCLRVMTDNGEHHAVAQVRAAIKEV